MLTKQDRESLRKDFEKIFVTKDEFIATTDNIIELITSVANNILIEIGGIREDLKTHADILENHERRIDKLETSYN